mgnify:CR=1 FL=1
MIKTNKTKLELWVKVNSLLQSILIVLSIYYKSIFIYMLVIIILHCYLFLFDLNNKQRLLPNSVTLLRLCHIPMLFLFKFDLSIITTVIVSFLILDGLDGLIAKKLNVASKFGEFFDKECDASFVSFVTLLISIETTLYYLAIIGLLRYVFVLVSYLIKKIKKLRELPDHSSQFNRISFVLFLACIIVGCYFHQYVWANLIWNVGFLIMLLSYLLSFVFILSKQYDY